jgi:hypothetical protein
MMIAIFNNLPEMLLGLVYTYTIFRVGRWSASRWPSKKTAA